MIFPSPQQLLSWEDYMDYTKDITLNRPTVAPYDHDKTFEATRWYLDIMQRITSEQVISQKLYNKLAGVKEPWTWYCISEPWCGDAAWISPVLYLISRCNPLITFSVVLRDSNPEFIDQHLTNGGRAIPKLIACQTEGMTYLGEWGPRPAEIQQLVLSMKDNPAFTYGEKVKMIFGWYEQNKSRAIQDEFVDLTDKWAKQ